MEENKGVDGKKVMREREGGGRYGKEGKTNRWRDENFWGGGGWKQ